MNNLTNIVAGLSLTVATSISMQAIATVDDKAQAVSLLQRGIVEGDSEHIRNIVAGDYIQHNPQAPDGLEGLLGFVEYLATLQEPVAVNSVRVLKQDNLVVVHSEYSLDGPKAVFDLFRIENGQITEHWDAIQAIPTETVSGRSMLDGATTIADLEKTAANRKLVEDFVTDILVDGNGEKLQDYIGDTYHQHNPQVADGLGGLVQFISYLTENNISFGYKTIHNVVAEGNFVFTQSEGQFGGKPTAFYDLFRVDNGKIVEHWDVIQEIPAEFAHDNGMF